MSICQQDPTPPLSPAFQRDESIHPNSRPSSRRKMFKEQAPSTLPTHLSVAAPALLKFENWILNTEWNELFLLIKEK
jgi:hypothetical protein